MPTVVRTVEWIVANTRNGVDLQETLRFFVRDAYAKWGITYMLLGGDTDILPARFIESQVFNYGDNPADMYFACLDGSWNANHNDRFGENPDDDPDLYAEVYNGRLPASTLDDVSTVVDKVIGYETPYDIDYTDRLILMAEVLFPTDWKPGDPISFNGADIAEAIYWTYVQPSALDGVRMYESHSLYPGSVPETKQAAIDSMNAGFNYVGIIGRGWRDVVSLGDDVMLNEDADALTNTNRWSNLYKPYCSAAAFHFDCLAEHFLNNPNGGAISVIGTNNVSFVSATHLYENEYYNLLLTQSVVHIGETFARSREFRTPLAQLGDNVDYWTHLVYTMLADPEMPLITGPVRSFAVSHPANVGLGSTSISITVISDSLPVDSAVVCLSKDGEDYQVGITGASGTVVLDFAAESPGDISIVVQKHGWRPLGQRVAGVSQQRRVGDHCRQHCRSGCGGIGVVGVGARSGASNVRCGDHRRDGSGVRADRQRGGDGGVCRGAVER
jgi:hypothetical protein